MHGASVFIIIYSSIETFASIELTFALDRMNSRSKQPSIELTRYGSFQPLSSEFDFMRLARCKTHNKLYVRSRTITEPNPTIGVSSS